MRLRFPGLQFSLTRLPSRLWARFGFTFTSKTQAELEKHVALLARVSIERVSYEMDLIIASKRSYEVIAAMAESALLFQVIPDRICQRVDISGIIMIGVDRANGGHPTHR